MSVHDARYVSRPGDLGGVKGMGAEPKSRAQADDPNSDSTAHNGHILSKFS